MKKSKRHPQGDAFYISGWDFNNYGTVELSMKRVLCSVAGRADGHPGPAAFGVAVVDDAGNMVAEIGRSIGNATADFAAYYAVMAGLQTLVEQFGSGTNDMTVELSLDNELVKKQLNAELPITDPGLVPMFIEIHNTQIVSFPNLSWVLISSDNNSVARLLVNEVLDGVV
jgi:ribonuclease HI